jgi:hypothetical protein
LLRKLLFFTMICLTLFSFNYSSSAAAESNVQVNEEGPFRLLTGTFSNTDIHAGAREKLRQKTGWIVYTVEQNGLRLKTGTFKTRAEAEKGKQYIEEKFGWTMYVIK